MNSPSKDIKDFLEGVVTSTYPLYISFMPETDDAVCVSIIDGPGAPPEANYSYERPSIQIRVRANDYNIAYSILKDIQDSLHGLANTIINNITYVQALAQGGIMSLGYDEKKRVSIVLNFSIHRQE